MSSPLVSFVITVYNGAPYLEACIDNLLHNVAWSPFEIVLVDDGSSDGTAEIGRRLAAAYPAVRFHAFPRLGRGRALNVAIDLAGGEIIAIQDVDDHTLPWRLKFTVPYLTDETVALVGGGWIPVPEDHWLENGPPQVEEPVVPAVVEVRPVDLYKTCVLCHSGVIFRKSAWRAGGGYSETLISCIDYEFYIRMLAVGRCIYLPVPVVLFRTTRDTVFKKQSHKEWLKNLLTVQKVARERLPIPFHARINDLRPFVRVAIVYGRKLWARHAERAPAAGPPDQ